MSTPSLVPVRVLPEFATLRFTGPQKVLLGAGLLLLVSALVHAVVFLASGTPWEGPVSWRKPILFGFSFGITAVTIALFAGAIRMRPWLAWAMLGTLAVTSVAETALITLQTWRGVPSHFNFTTAFDALVFSAMGAVVSVIALVLVVLTVLTFTSMRDVPGSVKLAIRAGMVLLLVGQALGGMIIAVGIPPVVTGDEAAAFGAEGVLFGEAGILKSPHGVAMHALQVLPLLAWLAPVAGLAESRTRRAVLAATIGYTLVLGVSLLQTFTGQAPFALGVPMLALALVGILLVAVPYGRVGLALLGRLRG
ncbi:hypothetical protein [Diaminobutyricimonas sp. TR449]|uniref:hypothetical protein n=1 Tax=Diaminobutyricimonas sp. TR449 TaxID=2708076 RepID=UPI00141DA003|nr:hypothetical protein [Diaminobutyricimonas sp. TR449]